MRKIITKREQEKKAKRNQIIIGGILIFIMFGSMFGYFIFNTKEDERGIDGKVNYKGYLFLNKNGFWYLNLGEYNFAFSYNPEEIDRENIKFGKSGTGVSSGVDGVDNESAELSYLNEYVGKVVYLSYEDDGAFVEISRNLGNIVLRAQGACIEEKGCPENWPVRDCSNNFIIVREKESAEKTGRIYQVENCVFIEGPKDRLVELTDEFFFKIMGIVD